MAPIVLIGTVETMQSTTSGKDATMETQEFLDMAVRSPFRAFMKLNRPLEFLKPVPLGINLITTKEEGKE